MKILVSCVPFDNGKSGISVYVRSVIKSLRAAGHELTLIVEPEAEQFFLEYELIILPKWTKKPIVSMLYHLFVLPFTINKNNYDFCLILAGNRRTFGYYPLFTVAVIHDLAQYHVEAKYDKFRMCYLKKVLPFFIRRAPHVVAISNSTRNDLIQFWHVDSQKISVNYNGLSIEKSDKVTEFMRNNELKTKKYIFYVSRIEHPGKNHLNLIKAYEKLPKSLKESYKLVFAGSLWHGGEVVQEYAKESLDSKSIVFSGFIEMSELPEAYKNAKVYVFPSFFEGFGLSLIEAMYYQVPVCCSNNSSLGEIGEGAALLFDPNNIDEISEALRKILEDEDGICERLITAGNERWKLFNWDEHAKTLVEIYENKHKN